MPLTCEWEGERGVALPLRPPPWWAVPLFGLLTIAIVAALVAGAVRLVRGGTTAGPVSLVAGFAVLLLFAWLFALATRESLRRRREPGQIGVTPTWLVADRVQVQWTLVDAVLATQEQRQGHLRPIDNACVSVEGRTITLYEARHLDVEPRATLEALRRLHRNPALRARLATDDGPGIFTRVPAEGSRS
ncbi:hypothetical protein [Janibacter sp. Soil728]|uniref:hypothetical protein n=1 Tax=Janibacter sp. Soil728 TaxID=1736393 RepID=UPI0012E97077|nr:hypothetical protein [Janibacter sp. Soil728]